MFRQSSIEQTRFILRYDRGAALLLNSFPTPLPDLASAQRPLTGSFPNCPRPKTQHRPQSIQNPELAVYY
jgi:hypothetical protein